MSLPKDSDHLVNVAPSSACYGDTLLSSVWSLSYLNLKSIPWYKFYCFPLSCHWGNQGLNQLINLSGSEAGRKRQSWDLNQVRTDSRGWVLNLCSAKLLHHLTTASSHSSLEIDASPVSHPVHNWSRNKIFFITASLFSPCVYPLFTHPATE